MKTEILGGFVVFSFGAPLCPWDADPEKYLIEITGKIKTWGEGDEPDVKVGTIRMKLLKLSEALRDGVTLYHVLDCHNIEELYPVLFQKDGAFLPDLEIEAPYGDLLIIESVDLKARFEDTDLRHRAIESAIISCASVGITLVRKGILGLGEVDRGDLGYNDLSFEDYLYRDNLHQNP